MRNIWTICAALVLCALVARSEAVESPSMSWGNWVFLEGDSYREFFSPVPVKGVRFFSDPEGNCFLAAVVPDASLETIPRPDWFSSEGIGEAPGKPGGDSMSWGRWALVDKKGYREFYPPGPRAKGVRWFADPEGKCFRQSVVPDPVMTPIDLPDWFSSESMGTPPRGFGKR